ncbi:MAG: flagellar motor protein MotB [Acidobacteriota bacterium]|nr:MAG: flagellar motor protein MotB [Acidobacteriota bacterium]
MADLTPPEEVKAGAPEWVVTFGDMMSLLMCFFVLLLSFSTMESERFKVVAGYIREAFGVQVTERFTEIPAGETLIAESFNEPSAAAVAVGDMKKLAEELNLDSFVETEVEKDQIKVTLTGELGFAPGQADIGPEVYPLLDQAAKIATSWGASVTVSGHTDNTPTSTPRFPSNWELSAARAAAVVRYLREKGVPGTHLEAVAYADTRPLTENFTAEGRRRNRRVEILIKPNG